MPKNDNFSPRQQEYFHSSHQGVYKEKKTKYYYQTGLEEFESKSIKNDPKSMGSTRGVGSNDNMDITTPRKSIRKSDKNSFCMSFEAGSHSCEVDNEQITNNGWTVCFDADNHDSGVDVHFDVIHYGDSGFCNPTDKNPMKASLFLHYHVIPEIVKLMLCSRYKNLEHYHKNIEAMLKTLIYQRIRRIRYYKRVERHLKEYDTDAELLGFVRDENNGRHIPDKKTIGHFENTRLGIKGMNEIRDAYVVTLKNELAKYGCEFGEKISIDSTPLTALSKDPEGRYNLHYEKYMYKVHIVTDVNTNIPLFTMVSSGTEYDGHYLIPILEKLSSLGIHPKKIYADGHYDIIENWAIVSMKYGAKLQIKLAENSIFRDDGKLKYLQKEYQKLHHNDDFKPQDQIGFDEMLQYLFEHGKYDCVGAYFRNQWYLKWKKKMVELKKNSEEEKNPRSKSEGLHGHLKENMMFEVFMDGRGMRYAEKHVNMILISLLVVALTRVQYGVLEGLTRIACLT